MRRQVSLLLDHGHVHAPKYPLAMLWEEAQIVVERMNQEEASRTTLMHAAASAVMSKKGQQSLRKLLRELTNE